MPGSDEDVYLIACKVAMPDSRESPTQAPVQFSLARLMLVVVLAGLTFGALRAMGSRAAIMLTISVVLTVVFVGGVVVAARGFDRMNAIQQRIRQSRAFANVHMAISIAYVVWVIAQVRDQPSPP